jgi:multiple sugar transport system ATP-binding protein
MTLSTKVAVLNSGNVQQLDPPHLIYTRPANQFVAGFVGSPQMNLFVLKCQENFAMLGDFPVRLPDLPTMPPDIVLGIRPEHVSLAGETEAGETAIKGEVYLVENLGMQNLISIRFKGDDSPTVRALLPGDRPVNYENVELFFPPQSIHWFDVKTGDRLQ